MAKQKQVSECKRCHAVNEKLYALQVELTALLQVNEELQSVIHQLRLQLQEQAAALAGVNVYGWFGEPVE